MASDGGLADAHRGIISDRITERKVWSSHRSFRACLTSFSKLGWCALTGVHSVLSVLYIDLHTFMCIHLYENFS